MIACHEVGREAIGFVMALGLAPMALPTTMSGLVSQRRKSHGGGGAEGNRTPDLLIANEALSQLSYSPAVQAADNADRGPASQPCGRPPLRTVAPDGRLGRVRAAPGRPDVITALFQLINAVIGLFIWALILAAMFSMLTAFGVLDTRNRLVWTIGDFLYRVTEPVLRPVRNMLPNFGNIDLSPIVVILLLQYIARPAARHALSSAIGPGRLDASTNRHARPDHRRHGDRRRAAGRGGRAGRRARRSGRAWPSSWSATTRPAPSMSATRTAPRSRPGCDAQTIRLPADAPQAGAARARSRG